MGEFRGYLDTVIISAVVKNDIATAEMDAVRQLLEWNESGHVSPGLFVSRRR